VSAGEYSLFAAVTVGVVANVVGSWIAYAVGYFGRIDILEKHGKKLHIKPSHLAWADRWFEKYGSWTVFLTRMLPIIRTFISLPAGVARMPFWRFTLLTALGCIPWIFMLTFIGKQVGDNWESWKDSLHYVDYAVAAVIVLGLLYLVVRNRRGKKPEAAGEPAADASR
jgi:membrane protein DedA with SNARE-associated domain